MKHLIMLLFLTWLWGSHRVSAQEKTDVYCIVYGSYYGIPNTLHIKIDYGQPDGLMPLTDTAMIPKLNRVKLCRSEAEVLNYMVYSGWTYVNTDRPAGAFYFYFKKAYPVALVMPKTPVARKETVKSTYTDEGN